MIRMSLVSATFGVGVLESEMNMAGRRRKGKVGGKDGLQESKRIERAFKSIGLLSLVCDAGMDGTKRDSTGNVM